MKYLKVLALATALTGFTAFTAHAQVLVSYGYPAAATGSDAVPPPAPVSETPYAGGSTYVGTGLGPTANTFISGYLTYDPDSSSTLSQAVSNDTFYSFTITPTAGDVITLTSFNLATTTLYTNSNNATFALESSVSGFGSSASDVLATFSPTTTGYNVPLIGLGYVADTKAVEFRLYVYGGNPFYVALQDGPLTINGVGTVAPEPSSWMLLGLGLGGMIFAVRSRRSLRV